MTTPSEPRNFDDWLSSYVAYASFSEAPRRMHFWAGVSAVAGALRRRVWIDQRYFKWTPCFYIVLVAPPGIISKSTTAAIAMDLLRKVPGVNFGPQVVTWPALVTAFAECNESFEIAGEWHSQCALTLESSEFGNLVKPQDNEMVDLLVDLWDSKQGAFKKATKGNGVDVIENPWINMIGCTTPAWIAGNFPEYMIGGGFTSRCLFVFGDKKDRLVAYPHLHVPKDMESTKRLLVADLERISQLAGEYTLLPETLAWGEEWYAKHYAALPSHLEDDRFSGYLARKQTHIHKLSMVLAASRRDDLVITLTDLKDASIMVTDLERDMPEVFSKIGRSQQSVQAEKFIKFVLKKKQVSYAEAYQHVHMYFPKAGDFEQMVKGVLLSKLLDMISVPGKGFYFTAHIDHLIPGSPGANSQLVNQASA